MSTESEPVVEHDRGERFQEFVFDPEAGQWVHEPPTGDEAVRDDEGNIVEFTADPVPLEEAV